MANFTYPENLTNEQAEVIEQAAMQIIRAREEAGAMLKRAGIEPIEDGSPFVSRCGARLPAPPLNHFCGCPGYKGNGGECINHFIDFTGPDFGSGAPSRRCGHRPSQHVIQI